MNNFNQTLFSFYDTFRNFSPQDCTLILTEGDSAKSLAIAGLGVIGKDKFGVFPLRGKLLNVREASHKQVSLRVSGTFAKKGINYSEHQVVKLHLDFRFKIITI